VAEVEHFFKPRIEAGEAFEPEAGEENMDTVQAFPDTAQAFPDAALVCD